MSSDNSVEVIGLDVSGLTSPDISRIFVSQTDPAEEGTTLNDDQDVWIEAAGTDTGSGSGSGSGSDSDSGSGSGSGSDSGGSVEEQLEAEFHTATNEHRESQGLTPFSYRDDVAAVCRLHSENMAQQSSLSHTLNGSDMSDRLDDAGISYSSAAENIAYQSTDPIDGSQGQLAEIAQSFIDSWLTSSGHRENIESDNDSEGIGVYIDESNNIVWATAVMITE